MIKYLYLILFLPFFSYASLEEKQLNNLYREVKCLVCAGQNIAESNAEHAIILKDFIKELAKKGATESEVKLYLVDKFGPDILFSPPNKGLYKLLWAFPYLLLSLIFIYTLYKRFYLK